MKTIRDLLGEHQLFRDFHPDLLELMAGCGHNVHFEAYGAMFIGRRSQALASTNSRRWMNRGWPRRSG